MLDILLIAHFTQAPGEKGNGRFHYIAENFDKETANIEILTSSFSHKTKAQRLVTEEQLNSVSYKFTMLHEPDYKKNVSLNRFYSHYVFGKNLKTYLENRKKPDLIYCAVPSLDAAYVVAKYAKKNNIRFIIDVQDLWPEAFKMVFNVPIISNLIFYPMKKKANYIYNSADNVIAVSETYVDAVLSSLPNQKKGLSIFLGTELAYFDQLAENNDIDKPSDEIWIAYIGTLGHSYDLVCVIDALHLLKLKGIENIKFVVMGDGPLKTNFMDYAKEKDIYSEFYGRLDYSKMVKILVNCDIAVNPIRKGAAGSIINKVGDYAAAGLPVLNTQENEEYRNLLIEFNAGLNCDNNNPIDLADKLFTLYDDNSLRTQLGANNRKLAEEKFDRMFTYSVITNLINETK